MALTAKQRQWARGVYSTFGIPRCFFPLYSEAKGWFYCGSMKSIQIHHIKPQGWCLRILKIDPDYPQNLIAICAYHHIGKGYHGSLDWRNDYVPVIHTDMAWAFQHYRDSEGDAINRVFAGRVARTDRGDIYWNTDHDDQLEEIAERMVSNHNIEFAY